MSTQQVAQDFVALCRQGQFSEAGEKYWSPDVLSVEAGGGSPMSEVRGLDAVRGKGEWWEANHDVHGVVVEGPFPNGDQFAVVFKMDVTFKPENRRFTMEEVALYTLKDGKIAEERFFYSGGPEA